MRKVILLLLLISCQLETKKNELYRKYRALDAPIIDHWTKEVEKANKIVSEYVPYLELYGLYFRNRDAIETIITRLDQKILQINPKAFEKSADREL